MSTLQGWEQARGKALVVSPAATGLLTWEGLTKAQAGDPEPQHPPEWGWPLSSWDCAEGARSGPGAFPAPSRPKSCRDDRPGNGAGSTWEQLLTPECPSLLTRALHLGIETWPERGAL